MDLLLVFAVAGILSGCDTDVPTLKKKAEGMVAQVKIILFGEPDPAPTPEHDVPREIKKEMDPGQDPAKVKGELAKENQELLAEMMRVVFDLTDIQDKADFGERSATLNQGASLEGIYQGLISGPKYRGLEGQSRGATPEALKAFALELAEIRIDMKNPTVYVDGDARKPVAIDFPDENAADHAGNSAQSSASQEEGAEKPAPTRESIAADLSRMFVGASPFTLKRILCDEALKRIDELRDATGKVNSEDVANWFAKSAVRLSGKGVDYGLPERNSAEFDFHYAWAKRMAMDRIKWEVLNRYHRYLNSFSHPK